MSCTTQSANIFYSSSQPFCVNNIIFISCCMFQVMDYDTASSLTPKSASREARASIRVRMRTMVNDAVMPFAYVMVTLDIYPIGYSIVRMIVIHLYDDHAYRAIERAKIK